MLSLKPSKTHVGFRNYWIALKAVATMARDSEQTQSVFDIEDSLRPLDATQNAVDYVTQDPAVKQMFEERYLAPKADVEALLKLPEGTLGSAYAHHIVDHGFEADYFRKIDVKDDIDYLMMRMRQNHDIWHVMTGIDVDPIGEISLKAFELAQTRRPMSAVITTGGVLQHLLANGDRLGDVLEAVSVGYRMGANARPFLSQKWEDQWERKVNDLRTELNVSHPDTHH